MEKLAFSQSYALYDAKTTRAIEQEFADQNLMQRAGVSIARLSLALYPHAKHFWIAAGPGNNGGDGLIAALYLHRWGKKVSITRVPTERTNTDIQNALDQLQAADLNIAADPPETFDVIVDGLLGLGIEANRKDAVIQSCIEHMNTSGKPILAIDVPSGLCSDTGRVIYPQCVHASVTLSLLTLKSGLLTGHGRAHAGDIWWDDLNITPSNSHKAKTFTIASQPPFFPAHALDAHKGERGTVAVIGGVTGMTGAALLAARAALKKGAGRVFVSLLDQNMNFDATQAELMFRHWQALDLAHTTIVCGCGGGIEVEAALPQILAESHQLVLDADALRAIANDVELGLQAALKNRNKQITILTPHPGEAADLLRCSVDEIQNDRLKAARQLSTKFACTVVLKGSGTIVASPGLPLAINPTGNAQLATAGSGDVLAGWIASVLAQYPKLPAHDLVCRAVFAHGFTAENLAIRCTAELI